MMAVPARATRRLSEAQAHGKPVVVIVGPTAVGKSRIAVEVAKAFETEVLTADSRQVYRGMDVGTDKPVPEERQAVPHRLIDLVDPDESFNAGMYRRQ
ncbi:MAG: isopentenyl transferase family protein, partial [Nitrospiraceae bacterium]